MIISNSGKYIFVHIMKAAGTTISRTLDKSLKWNDIVLGSTPIGEAIQGPFRKRFSLHKHSRASEIQSAVGERIWNDYFTFAFVRNPWDLMVSSYFWWVQKSSRWEKYRDDTALTSQMNGFNEFILSNYGREMINECKGNIYDWISADGEIIVDFVGRFEQIQADWQIICRQIGLRHFELPWLNKSNRQPYQDY